MKQHITSKQLKELGEWNEVNKFHSENDFDLFEHNDEEYYYEQLSKQVTIGKMIEILRKYYQTQIYTDNEYWCVQLFDLNDCPNDEPYVFCIWEDSSKDLCDILWTAITEEIL